MRKTFVLAVVTLCCLAVALPALAWEFKTKGDLEWRYIYWTRSGNMDIFGQMGGPVDLGVNHLSTFPTRATTNNISNAFPIIGVVAGQPRYGSDMNLVDYKMTLYPTIKVNPAISISGSMNFTSLGIWSDGAPYVGGTLNPPPSVPNVGYANSLYVPIQDRPVAAHVPNTYVTMQWVKLGITTPWMGFSIGYKTSGFGIGLWKHPCNRASASFSITAKYGPLSIGFSPYFARELSSWNHLAGRNEGGGSPQRHDDRRDYFLAYEGEVTYKSGPLVIQLLSDSYHQKDAPAVRARGAALPPVVYGLPANTAPSDDILRYRIGAAVKYFDGRFFFDAEADWFNRWRSGRGTASTTNALNPVNQQEDDKSWLYGVETGCLVGPTKVTLSYVRALGDDPTTRFTIEDASSAESGANACFMKQWGYLMYYMYGTGDGWDAEGHGQPTNFHHAGIRVDHAVASNLNVSWTFSKAWRDQPNAYTFGGDYRIQARRYSNNDLRAFQNAGNVVGVLPRPVPDHNRHIGWEVDLGINWKLLENLSWNTTIAYWKPGNWWGAAYPNTAALYTLNPGAAIFGAGQIATTEAQATINFDRAIDPLIAMETNLLVTF